PESATQTPPRGDPPRGRAGGREPEARHHGFETVAERPPQPAGDAAGRPPRPAGAPQSDLLRERGSSGRAGVGPGRGDLELGLQDVVLAAQDAVLVLELGDPD